MIKRHVKLVAPAPGRIHPARVLQRPAKDAAWMRVIWAVSGPPRRIARALARTVMPTQTLEIATPSPAAPGAQSSMAAKATAHPATRSKPATHAPTRQAATGSRQAAMEPAGAATSTETNPPATHSLDAPGPNRPASKSHVRGKVQASRPGAGGAARHCQNHASLLPMAR